MAIAHTVRQYLDNNRVSHETLLVQPFTALEDAAAELGIPLQHVVKATLLMDQIGPVMAITLATHEVDIAALGTLLRRNFVLASEAQIASAFRDCHSAAIPPLGEAYGVRTILDDQVLSNNDLHFSSGASNALIKVSSKVFHQALCNAWLGGGFTREQSKANAQATLANTGADTDGDSSDPLYNIRKRLSKINDLPPMPEMAMRVITLSHDANAGAEDLAKIVELDPSLAAQVIRYASSPFFGYQGRVDSLRTAIARVLGYDMVMNLALGIASARPFKIPQFGPLGLKAFWRHATYSAALNQALARAMPAKLRPRVGLAYLSGLLHNFGHLLLGHKFRQEFLLLTDMLNAHPDTPVIELETSILGIDHTQLGGWLMDAWGMPEEITIAVREHHNELYNGPHAVYAHLTLISDRMLKAHGIGDGTSAELPKEILTSLGLDEVRVLTVMNEILNGCEGLNTMAQQLAA